MLPIVLPYLSGDLDRITMNLRQLPVLFHRFVIAFKAVHESNIALIKAFGRDDLEQKLNF